MKPLISLAILLIIATFPACFDEIPTKLSGIPDATMSGKNTIGYRLNGLEFYNELEGDAQLNWDSTQSLLAISAGFQDHSNINLLLHIPDPSIKDYVIDSTALFDHVDPMDTVETEAFFDGGKPSPCLYHVGGDDPRTASTMKIHFTRLNPNDPRDGIISGTFEMSLKAKGCSNAEVMDGRFDIEIGNGPRGIH